ncbi:hypothetical protein Y032_0031g2287 [Ancylostoma ceylanicum]|uniref:Secreted protein n=1 Tax=Ancylostoma ceylanicum TaxID=53326 RepID=A0A016UP10_9BILA|nr:hypothetical protein Y032_0031g2287 [Ancylostoma ceylanicum]
MLDVEFQAFLGLALLLQSSLQENSLSRAISDEITADQTTRSFVVRMEIQSLFYKSTGGISHGCFWDVV